MRYLALISCLILPMVAHAWQMEQQEGGVTLYSKPSPKSSADTLKAQIEIPLPVDFLGAILTDLTQHKNFVPHMKEVVVLMTTTNPDGEVFSLIHQTTSLPVINDRDVVLRTRTKREALEKSSRWVSTFWAVQGLGPEPESGVVRMPYMTGAWTIRPSGKPGQSLLTYTTTAEVGGLIPETIAAASKGDTLVELLINFKRYALAQSRAN